MTGEKVKGWCPGAYRPMQSGDGLVFRVRPIMAEITAQQAIGLAELALRFGSGIIDLTNRANVQIRGVDAGDAQQVVSGLGELGLLDKEPILESRRNILVTPFWTQGDLTDRLESKIRAALVHLPELPAKVGYSIDTGPSPLLGDAPADFRFERGVSGLILRADGCARGRSVTLETALDALVDMVHWFNKNRGEQRRMSRVLRDVRLPAQWQTAAALPQRSPPGLGVVDGANQTKYVMLGAPFGQIEARNLIALCQGNNLKTLRITPWRSLSVPYQDNLAVSGFLCSGNGSAMRVNACVGAPNCSRATVETRQMSMEQMDMVQKHMHISGCDKGCAHPGPADVTLVGRDGKFDLVRNGAAWDRPDETGLSFEEAAERGGVI